MKHFLGFCQGELIASHSLTIIKFFDIKLHMAKTVRKKLEILEKVIILGILLFLLGTITHSQIYLKSLMSQREESKKEVSGQAPTLISIPSLKADIKVIKGGIANGNWVLSDSEALYLPTSGKIGEGFNTILYAHNRENLFGNLKKIQKGDLLVIKDNADKDFIYKVYLIENIDPRDIKRLFSEEKDIVTLFTCDGWFDQERLLVRGKLINK